MKSRTEILVPIAAIQAVPIAVIAWYRLHRYAWYRYSAIVKTNPELRMTHTEFRDKKNKNNIDMVTQIETLFIFMFDEEFFYMQLFFIRISFLYTS